MSADNLVLEVDYSYAGNFGEEVARKVVQSGTAGP
jgi:hypothetical protein